MTRNVIIELNVAIDLLLSGHTEQALIVIKSVRDFLDNSDNMFQTMFGPGEQADGPLVEKSEVMAAAAGIPIQGASAEWARGYRYLDGQREEIVRISYQLFQVLGFEPKPPETKAAWLKAIDDLLEAAGGKTAILMRGLEDARESRDNDGLTMAGPRSVVKFVSSARAKAATSNKSKRIKA